MGWYMTESKQTELASLVLSEAKAASPNGMSPSFRGRCSAGGWSSNGAGIGKEMGFGMEMEMGVSLMPG